LRSNTIYQTK